MQSPDTEAGARPRRSTLTLWLILAVCAAPVALSYLAFYLWRPASHVNYGELIEPHPLPPAQLTLHGGRPFALAELKGEWVLLVAGRAACDDACRARLVYIRQVRLAQGKEAGRIERVWLVTDGAAPDPALLAEHPGLIVARERDGRLVEALPAERSAADHVYVVDPVGNLMMRFPRDPDPRRMLKDIARLLRHSKWK